MAFTTVSDKMCEDFSQYYPLNISNQRVPRTLQTLLKGTPGRLHQCCYMGYLDTRRRLISLSGANRTLFIIGVIKNITNFVNGLTNIANQPNFDTAFCNLCNDIINIGRTHGVVTRGNPHSTLTFGCAQKIVNMTLKYVYNEIRLGNTVVNSDVDAYIRNTACNFFHMPIDSIVLCKLHYVPVNPPFHTRIYLRNNTWTYNKKPWSFLDDKDYIQFVTDLRANLMTCIKPLEAEYHTWRNPNPTSLKGWIYK